MTPTKAGRYLAVPMEWTVENVGTAQTVSFTCNFIITHQLVDNEWEDVADRGMTIIGNSYIVKKTGELNPHAIKSLRDALGWDGISFTVLANSDWSNTQVQLTIEPETRTTDDGQTRTSMKVKWINHKDWTGGSISRDPAAIQSLEDKYGAMLRAEAGPAKPAAPAKPANGNGNPPANPLDLAKKDAWAKWLRMHPEMGKDERASEYRAAAIDYFETENFGGINAIQWKAFAANDFKKVASPIVEDEAHFTQDDIPF